MIHVEVSSLNIYRLLYRPNVFKIKLNQGWQVNVHTLQTPRYVQQRHPHYQQTPCAWLWLFGLKIWFLTNLFFFGSCNPSWNWFQSHSRSYSVRESKSYPTGLGRAVDPTSIVRVQHPSLLSLSFSFCVNPAFRRFRYYCQPQFGRGTVDFHFCIVQFTVYVY